AELKRQKAAFRRGVLRATAIYGLILAVMAGLTSYAMRQKRSADVNALAARAAELSARNESGELRHRIYITDMNLIQRDWEDGRMGNVQYLLNETSRYDRRGFEWGYWQRASHPERLSFHPAGPCSAVVSRDGRFTMTAEATGTAKVWDLETGRERLTLRLPGAIFYSFA